MAISVKESREMEKSPGRRGVEFILMVVMVVWSLVGGRGSSSSLRENENVWS